MYKLCNMRKWACLFLILPITLFALPGSADPAETDGTLSVEESIDSEVAELRTEVERLRGEQRALDTQIAAEKEQVDGVLRQKALMDQQILLLSTEIACFDRMLLRYDDLLAAEEAAYSRLSESYDTHFAVLAERLRQSYEEGMPGISKLFSRSDSLLSLLTGLARLREIEAYDRSLMEALEREQTELVELRAHMEEYRYERHMVALEQVERMQLLNARLQDSGNYLQSLIGDLNRFSYYIQQSQAGEQIADRQIADNVAALLKQIAENGNDFLMAEKEAKLQAMGDTVKADMEAGLLQKGVEFFADGAKYIWPLAIDADRSATVLAPMGYRTYQVEGKVITAYHSGADLAADFGSAVLAAASGKVVEVGNADGYGNYVVVWHEDGSQTRYAHLGEALVQVGDYVLQGESVATAGCSGNSVGIGCRFELRIDGVIVDPLLHLTLPVSAEQTESAH